jgi:hypothetical protein
MPEAVVNIFSCTRVMALYIKACLRGNRRGRVRRGPFNPKAGWREVMNMMQIVKDSVT